MADGAASTVTSLEGVVRDLIVKRLDLHLEPSEIADDTPFFAPASAGGLEIDSLSSLEILSVLADHFQMPLDDIEPANFHSIKTLSDYLRAHGVAG